METKIQKWGNSQGLRLAQSLLKEVGLSMGDEVRVVVNDNNIVISKASVKYPSLEDLVKKIPKKSKKFKGGDAFGKPMGKEVW